MGPYGKFNLYILFFRRGRYRLGVSNTEKEKLRNWRTHATFRQYAYCLIPLGQILQISGSHIPRAERRYEFDAQPGTDQAFPAFLPGMPRSICLPALFPFSRAFPVRHMEIIDFVTHHPFGDAQFGRGITDASS